MSRRRGPIIWIHRRSLARPTTIARHCCVAIGLLLCLLMNCGLRQAVATQKKTQTKTPKKAPNTPIRPDAATRIARKLAKDIVRSVAHIRGIHLNKPLRVRVYDKQALRKFVVSQLQQNQGKAHLNKLSRALRLFGLVDRKIGLHQAYLALLQEQVAGLYDPAAKELRIMRKLVPVGVQLPNPLHLLTGSPEDQLRFVMAHEIVHALQDQRWNLARLAKDRRGETDLETALSSLFEGDATLSALLWAMKDRRGSVDVQALLAAGPVIKRLLTGALAMAKAGVLPGGAGLAEAPAFLQERLVVPYTAGLGLCMAAARRGMGQSRAARNGSRRKSKLQKHPKRGAKMMPTADPMVGLNALYSHPPLSMEQVLHPEKMWAQKPDYPVRLKLPQRLKIQGFSAKSVYRDNLGELYIRRLLRDVMAEKAADRAAAGWGGDRYVLMTTTSGDALLWMSTWDTAKDASEFAQAAHLVLKTWAAHDKGSGGAAKGESGLLRVGDDVLIWRGLPKKVGRRFAAKVHAQTRRSLLRRLPK